MENNNINLERLEGTANMAIDGIRVWGHLGERVLITKNYVSSADENKSNSFTRGINVNPIEKKPLAQWLVMYNMVPSKLHPPVRVVNGALELAGTNLG